MISRTETPFLLVTAVHNYTFPPLPKRSTNLPISNDSLVPIAHSSDTIPLRCRSGSPQHNDTHAGESTPLNGNGFYAVDEQNENSEISRKEGDALWLLVLSGTFSGK